MNRNQNWKLHVEKKEIDDIFRDDAEFDDIIMNTRHKLETKMIPSWHESPKEDSIRSDENFCEGSVWTRQGDQFQQRFEQKIEAYGGTRNRSEEIRNKFHEHHNVNKEFHSWTYLNSDHQLLLMKKNMRILSTKVAVHKKERSKLNILSAWNEAKVKSKHEIRNELQTIFTIHETEWKINLGDWNRMYSF